MTLSGENGIVGVAQPSSEMWLHALGDKAERCLETVVTGGLVDLLSKVWSCLPPDSLLYIRLFKSLLVAILLLSPEDIWINIDAII